MRLNVMLCSRTNEYKINMSTVNTKGTRIKACGKNRLFYEMKW